jgi:outer membrane protein assembly factor BamB
MPTPRRRDDNRWQVHLLTLSLLLISGCGSSNWMEFHGDGANRGFAPVHSEDAVSTTWVHDVGKVAFASPVIAADNTVYIGNLAGELVAVAPDNQEKWKIKLSGESTISASAAIGSDGYIYAISTGQIDDRRFQSTLFGISPSGQILTSYSLPDEGFTTAAPKAWGTGRDLVVFVTYRRVKDFSHYIVVLRAADMVELTRQTLYCPQDLEGEGVIEWRTLVTALTGGLVPPDFRFEAAGIPQSPLLDQDPTLAVVDSDRLTPSGHPVVVAANNACALYAFEWDPASQTLGQLWRQWDHDLHVSSPAVSSDGQIAIGREDGHVKGYDFLNKGSVKWDFNAREPVLATPGFFLGVTDVYVPSLTHIHQLNYGSSVHSRPLAATPIRSISSPALTWDRVYVSSEAGFYTFGFDFTTTQRDVVAANAIASPAVGPDGSIYVVTQQGMLRKYPGASRWALRYSG